MRALRRWSHTLRFKFIATALGIQLLTLALLTWISLETTSQAMIEQAHDQIHGMAPLINASLAAPLRHQDLPVLQERVEGILASNRFRYILITDPQGTKILERGEPAAPTRHTHATHFHHPGELDHPGLDAPRVALQIDSLAVGYAVIQVNDDRMHQVLLRLRDSGVTVALLAIGMTLMLLTLTGTILTQGLHGLTQAARRLADGDLTSRVYVQGNDEVADVGRAFNAMSESLTRKHADLLEKGQHIQLLLDSTTEAICGIDLAGCCTFANQACVRMLKLGGEKELLGRKLIELMPLPDDFMRMVAEGTLFHSDQLVLGEPGALATSLECWSHPIIEGKAVVGAVITILDVSNRRRAETLLRDSEVKLRAIVDNSPTLIMMRDVNGKVTLLNQFTGSRDDPDTVVAALTNVLEHQAKAYARQDSAMVQVAAAAGEYELVVPRPDGAQTHYSAVAFPLYGDNQEVLGTGAIALDVTERRQMQDALIKSEERFNLAVRGSTDGIWDWNLDTNEIYLSERFKELLGYRSDELGNTWHGWEEWVHTDDVSAVSDEINEHLSTHTPCRFECRLRCKSGDYRWFLVRGQAAEGAAGVPPRMAGSITDITYRRETEAQIRQMAYYDELTGLPNRRLVMEELRRRIDEVPRDGNPEAVVFVDLDHFKKINDSLGHHYGDALLKRVGERLRSEVRSDDLVGRLGGDEFIVLLTNLGSDPAAAGLAAAKVTDNLMRALAQPYDLDGHQYHVTPSMGVILFPEGSETVEDVMKRADTALYASKSDGRNTVSFYQPEMQLAVDSRLMIEKELRLAIERNELELYFQPQFHGTKGHLIGAEALLRWNHASKGFISPIEFIPVAEESGLIIPLGRWVLESVIHKIKAWETQGLLGQDIAIAANLSARQFFERSLVKDITQLLSRNDLPGRRLKLELTESTLVQNIEEAIGKIEMLKSQGIGFALDDFGTGYSSLSYLKTLPVDELKIDRSFVRDIPDDSNDAAITETIIAMARHLNLLVVAEGVETAEQLKFLQAHGCNTYQGYYFSHPLPCDTFERLLQKHAGRLSNAASKAPKPPRRAKLG